MSSLYRNDQLDPGIISLAFPTDKTSVASAFANAFTGYDNFKQQEKERGQKDTLFNQTTQKNDIDIQNGQNELSLFDNKKKLSDLNVSNADLDNQLKQLTFGDNLTLSSANAKTAQNKSAMSDIELAFLPQEKQAGLNFTKANTTATLMNADSNRITANAHAQSSQAQTIKAMRETQVATTAKQKESAQGINSALGTIVNDWLGNPEKIENISGMWNRGVGGLTQGTFLQGSSGKDLNSLGMLATELARAENPGQGSEATAKRILKELETAAYSDNGLKDYLSNYAIKLGQLRQGLDKVYQGDAELLNQYNEFATAALPFKKEYVNNKGKTTDANANSTVVAQAGANSGTKPSASGGNSAWKKWDY